MVEKIPFHLALFITITLLIACICLNLILQSRSDKIANNLADSLYNEISKRDIKLVKYQEKERIHTEITQTIVKAYKKTELEAGVYAYMVQQFPGSWKSYIATLNVESHFDPTAISSANCKGLMQLKPDTQRMMSDELDFKYNHLKSPWNDIQNILCGFQYLSKGMKDDPGNEHRYYIGGRGWRKSRKVIYRERYYRIVVEETRMLDSVHQSLY